MMSYRRKNKKIFFVTFILILIVVFGFFKIGTPLSLVKDSSGFLIGVRDFMFSPFKNISTTFKNKRELENKIIYLEEELLKTQINLLSKDSGNIMLVSDNETFKVLSRPPYSIYDTLLVSKNGQDVRVGDLVFVDNFFIGEISEVNINTVSLKMKSSSGEKTVVRIAEVDSEAEGQGGGQYLVKIPKDLNVKIGDAVLVPSLNNVLLGIVGSVEQDSTGTFQNIRFSIPISFQSMNFVEIVKIEDVLK